MFFILDVEFNNVWVDESLQILSRKISSLSLGNILYVQRTNSHTKIIEIPFFRVNITVCIVWFTNKAYISVQKPLESVLVGRL